MIRKEISNKYLVSHIDIEKMDRCTNFSYFHIGEINPIINMNERGVQYDIIFLTRKFNMNKSGVQFDFIFLKREFTLRNMVTALHRK